MAEYKERDKSKKRAVIINGAEDVFLSMGYELASMDKIAAKAGVSKRTVYNHFASKENLFEVIVDNLLAERQNLKTIKYDTWIPGAIITWNATNPDIMRITIIFPCKYLLNTL